MSCSLTRADARRRYLCVRLALVVCALACGVVVPGVARATDSSGELARRYAPVVRIVEQKEDCGHGEAFVPTNVNLILGQPEVVLRGPWDKTNIIKIGPTAQDLSRGLPDYRLDFPGHAVTPGCTYDEWSHRINLGHAPTVYAHVVHDPAYPNELALQYWFFYVFNNFNDKHEGDWEMIQLDFDTATPEQALGMKPALVGYSQHEGAESAHWGDSKLQIVDGTHPVVYAALGSHANYFTSALHLGRSAAEGVGCDNTSGPSTQLTPKVELVPTDKAAYLRAFPWLGFQGHWGEEHEAFYNGPTGPSTKVQWTQPIMWANTEWHHNSFTVPAGSTVGGTATGFFCGTVATGSTLLTALVGNPSPFYFLLTAVFALILWLTSRTQWHPSAPLHLQRRRSWGSIVTASRRMYLGHLRLFLGIGLLFLPIGIFVTGVQYLIFRQGFLNGLVNSAGSSNADVVFLAVMLGVTFTGFGLAVLNGATMAAMADLDAGRQTGARAAYKQVLPKLGSILGVVVIAGVITGLVALTSIGLLLSIWLIVRWALVAQVVLLEDLSALAALRRSAKLVHRNWWRVATMLLFVTTVALLLGPLVGTLLLLVTNASFDFINLVSSVVYVFVLPYAAIASTYLYFDLRVVNQNEAESAEEGDVLPAETPSAAIAPRP
jgi:hypothetical protein